MNDDRAVATIVVEPHASTHDEVGFHPAECERVAVLIGTTSIALGGFTVMYATHADEGLPLPILWGIAHIAAGLAAIIAMRFRVQGYATAGAGIAGLAVMRGLALSTVGPGIIRGEWRNAVGILLWFSFAGSTWWIWSRVVARHVAWNRARAIQVQHPD